MLGDYHDNRIMVQNYFQSSKFITQHYSQRINLVESQNEAKKTAGKLGPRELVEVIINDVPSNRIKCGRFWKDKLIMNLEQHAMPFGQPLGCKSVEKAIIIIKDDTMHVLLCEMKSGLYFEEANVSGIGDNGVLKKIKDSITRFCSYLPIFHDNDCPVDKLRFHGLIFFNHEAVSKVLAKKDSKEELERMTLYQAFKNRNKNSSLVTIQDHYGNYHPVKVAFIQNNNNNSETMNVSFNFIENILGIK